MYFGGNHCATILIPITNPAPTQLRNKREISIWVNVFEKANTIVGIDIVTINQVNTTRAP